jgi:histidinol-phosphatase (PHP family)
MPLCDLHTHSHISPDGKAPIAELCAAAQARGIAVLCVTDHCDVNGWDNPPFKKYNFRRSEAEAELLRAREMYAGNLEVLAGIELGQATQASEEADMLLKSENLDFVIGSLHNLPGEHDFCFYDYGGDVDNQRLIHRYFTELIALAEDGRFDTLGHVGYPVRYLLREGKPLDLMAFRDDAAELFRVLIEKGRALEVNTSDLSTAFGNTLPPLELLQLYRSLGGDRITFGSDAHTPEWVGSGIARATELCRAAGFGYQTVYRRRVPHMLAL